MFVIQQTAVLPALPENLLQGGHDEQDHGDPVQQAEVGAGCSSKHLPLVSQETQTTKNEKFDLIHDIQLQNQHHQHHRHRLHLPLRRL